MRQKLEELFRAGVRRVTEFRTLLDNYVKTDLFAGQSEPPPSDARFWLSNKFILSFVSPLSSQSRFASVLIIGKISHLYCYYTVILLFIIVSSHAIRCFIFSMSIFLWRKNLKLSFNIRWLEIWTYNVFSLTLTYSKLLCIFVYNMLQHGLIFASSLSELWIIQLRSAVNRCSCNICVTTGTFR